MTEAFTSTLEEEPDPEELKELMDEIDELQDIVVQKRIDFVVFLLKKHDISQAIEVRHHIIHQAILVLKALEGEP